MKYILTFLITLLPNLGLASDLREIEKSPVSIAHSNRAAAESLISSAHQNLKQMREDIEKLKGLAQRVQNKNSLNDSEKERLNAEYKEVLDTMQTLAEKTRWSGATLIIGSQAQQAIENIKGIIQEEKLRQKNLNNIKY